MLLSLLEELSRRRKQSIALIADLIMLPVALWSAIALRLGEWSPEVAQFWPAFVVSALITIPVFIKLGLYRQIVRYMGNHAMLSVIKGATLAAIAISLTAYLVPLKGFPRSVPIIFLMLVLVYVAGTRFAVRGYINWLSQKFSAKKPVIIYGAGEAGAELARSLQQQGDYFPAAFLDDNLKVQKGSISGISIYPPSNLAHLLETTEAKEVLVAIPSTDSLARKRILEYLETFAVRVKLVPDLSDLVSGAVPVDKMRDVNIGDLLGRDAVEPMPRLLHGCVRNMSVMVTGAGGSIGSELCRQIVRLQPRMMVMLDQSEYALYLIQREISEFCISHSLQVPTVVVLGSVTDSALMHRTLNAYQVETLYHAAAYKHVSLVERNVIQGIKNNTFGTLCSAEAAMEAGVKNFILISTDKAVRTANMMGASKRLAELVLQAMQDNSSDTRFSMVRFGNVLGSSGSVVPLFSEQIEKGGPVTVTHPDVTRFFMTIPEAAQLVLQASSMAQGGDVFVLDMGKSVKILDLAKRMIHLKGLTVCDESNPQGEIKIKFTGLQSGEKLYEELLIEAGAVATEHQKIMRAEEKYMPWAEIRGALNTLKQACDSYDFESVRNFVIALVEGAELTQQLTDMSEQSYEPNSSDTVVPMPRTSMDK
ncbi:MAG: polysaccharide biosynthesis protein [Pseudomonadales bacterium]|nr:polysaccharide biosynthesis protein [Pseudomonadales bacterium]